MRLTDNYQTFVITESLSRLKMIKNALDFAGILSFFEERGPVFTIIYQLFIENVKGARQLFFFQFELGMFAIH